MWPIRFNTNGSRNSIPRMSETENKNSKKNLVSFVWWNFWFVSLNICLHLVYLKTIMQSINLSFTINLSNFILHSVIKHEPHRLHDSYILMTVKDNSFIGGGIFLGEALLKLEDIPLSQIDQGLSELPQIQLPLTKPSCHGRMGRNIFQLDNYRI